MTTRLGNQAGGRKTLPKEASATVVVRVDLSPTYPGPDTLVDEVDDESAEGSRDGDRAALGGRAGEDPSRQRHGGEAQELPDHRLDQRSPLRVQLRHPFAIDALHGYVSGDAC